jgi:hypothetical protein
VQDKRQKITGFNSMDGLAAAMAIRSSHMIAVFSAAFVCVSHATVEKG